MIKFPRDFLWGAATSAHQVEGNNLNSDWFHWEKKKAKEKSGQACRHYQLYKQDFDLAKKLHHNAHRFSIEWSRIEPKEGRFSDKELKHYLRVILALKERSIEPIVTLHHFTNPLWFAKSAGWTNASSVERFLRYCEFVVMHLAKHVRYWVTINEPTIYLSHSYLFGAWPPQQKSYLKAKAVEDNLSLAHIKAYRLIHDIYDEARLREPSIGIAQNMTAYVPCTPDMKDRFAAYLRDKWYNQEFLDRLARYKAMDFIGLNYYSRQLVEIRKMGIGNLAMDVCTQNHHPLKKNSLGWDIYPQGLCEILLGLKKYALPIIITENGICTSDDKQRWEYIKSHLKALHAAIKKGVKVKGYLYWSLMDNFEWDKGFAPRFGLLGIDYKTFKRTVRESARKYARVCKTGVL